MVIIMDHMRTSPTCFPRDAPPCHRLGTTPPIADMCLADVIRDWCTITVNFNTTANIRHIEVLLRVTQPIRIDDLHRCGIAAAPTPQSIWPVLQHRQRITIKQLVPKTRAQHLRHGLFALNIAITSRIISP